MTKVKSGKKIVWCKDHPEFDPYDLRAWPQHEDKDKFCNTCRTLHFGAVNAGGLILEYTVDEKIYNKATITIVAPGLKEFGNARLILAYYYRYAEGHSWYADVDAMKLYLYQTASADMIKEIEDCDCEVSCVEVSNG